MVPGLWFVVVAFAGEAAVLRGQLAGGLRRSRPRLGPEGAVDEAGREGDEDCSGDGANDADHIAADEVAVYPLSYGGSPPTITLAAHSPLCPTQLLPEDHSAIASPVPCSFRGREHGLA